MRMRPRISNADHASLHDPHVASLLVLRGLRLKFLAEFQLGGIHREGFGHQAGPILSLQAGAALNEVVEKLVGLLDGLGVVPVSE